MFGFVNKRSPVPHQDFIWVAEYYDGTYLAEFDFETKEENSFYDIQRDKLVRFGLVGLNRALFAEADGVFNLAGQTYQVSYITNRKEYLLSGNIRNKYNDIITYKDAQAIGLANYLAAERAPKQGKMFPQITQFNFGYKTKIVEDGITFHFKPIVSIPWNKPVYIKFWLVADKELDGKLVIRKGERVVTEIRAPLKPSVGGELNWVVR